MATLRTYTELLKIPTFLERFRYLKLGGQVGTETFGFDRYLNQAFYKSREWRSIRDKVIARDLGYDLASEDRPIGGRIIVHHMNPISEADIENSTELLLNPEYLISVSNDTHQAIHYGDESLLVCDPIIRKPNDTALWK